MAPSFRAQIIESKVINSQPGRYIAWPCIARKDNGELLVTFSGDRDAHVCPFGKTHLIRSLDNGDTWSREQVIVNTPLDDRDTGIMVTKAGTVLLRWFNTYIHPEHPGVAGHTVDRRESWRPYTDQITPEMVQFWAGLTDNDEHIGRRGHWLIRSPDGGHSWEEPTRVAGTSPKPAIQLQDGSLLMIGNDGYNRVARTTHIVVERSTDDGRSWDVIATEPMFPDEQGTYLGEPHLVEAEPGHIVALARSESRPYNDAVPRVLYQMDSHDSGRTWTPWRPTTMEGKPPHLQKLADGRLLATYGRRIAPFGQRATLSADGGQTWDTEHELILRDDAPNGDLGYPATVQLPDGELLTVYYQCERAGELPVMMLTHWRLVD